MLFERWQELKDLFGEAKELDSEGRRRLLDEVERQDLELWKRLVKLLSADQAGGVLDGPVENVHEGLDPSGGRRFGSYRVIREIGRGAMSVVYLAERADGQFEKSVALKVIPRALLSPEVTGRLRRERTVLANLSHPYIAQLHDTGETDELDAYLVMEYIDGTHLDLYCDEPDRSVEERLRLFVKICEAVSFSHQKLVIHRDLKPTNILVTADGVPKLLDFGIAALSGPSTNLTLTGYHRFTLDYASPEQIRQEGVPSTSTDIYSLGVLLYRMLARDLPHRTDNRLPHEIVKSILEEDPISLRERTREIPPDLESIVLKALEKEPRNRFISVEQFAATIEQYLAGFPIPVYRAGAMYRLGKLLRRRRLSIGVGALVLISISVAGYSLWLQNEVRGRLLKEAVDLSQALFADVGLVSPNTPKKLENLLISTLHVRGVLARLAKESGDETAQVRVVLLHLKASQILSNASSGQHLGRTAEACKIAREGAALADDLFRHAPERYPHSILVSVMHSAVGVLLLEMNRWTEAKAEFERAVAVHAQLRPDDRHYVEKRRNFTHALAHVSEIAFHVKDLPGCLRLRQAVVTNRRETVAVLRGDQSARQDLAGALGLYAEALREAGRTDEAIGAYQEALSLLDDLLKELEFIDWRSSHSRTLIQLGRTYFAGKRPAEGIRPLTEAVTSLRAIERLTPNSGNRRALAEALSWLAAAEHRVGHRKTAQALIREAVAIGDREAVRDPGSGRVRVEAQEIRLRARDIIEL